MLHCGFKAQKINKYFYNIISVHIHTMQASSQFTSAENNNFSKEERRSISKIVAFFLPLSCLWKYSIKICYDIAVNTSAFNKGFLFTISLQ
jgi:hypothetical protein